MMAAVIGTAVAGSLAYFSNNAINVSYVINGDAPIVHYIEAEEIAIEVEYKYEDLYIDIDTYEVMSDINAIITVESDKTVEIAFDLNYKWVEFDNQPESYRPVAIDIINDNEMSFINFNATSSPYGDGILYEHATTIKTALTSNTKEKFTLNFRFENKDGETAARKEYFSNHNNSILDFNFDVINFRLAE